MAVAAALTLSLAGLSRMPWDPRRGEDALLRLSWRLQPAAGEPCAQPSEEELARLPTHMRNPQACQPSLTPHRLEVEVDGEELLAEWVRPSGVRGDRPLYVLEEIPVAAGVHRVVVRFRPAAEGKGELLSFRGSLLFGPRSVVLLTYDPGERRLLVAGE